MKIVLGRKQSIKNSQWLEVANHIEDFVSYEEIDNLKNETIEEIKRAVKNKNSAYAWSAGKDSIVLGDLAKSAGIDKSMIGICNLEYPEFKNWIMTHKPDNCTVINTGQDIMWLQKHEYMLFPKDSKKAARWFAIVQHEAQKKYYKNTNLDIILLGRRRADGNYTGVNGIYTDGNGITRYSPLYLWKHEHILAYIHYYKLELPPIYNWYNGYLCGTHPWPARQWTENGWQEVYDIDKSIVQNAAKYLESAKIFLEEVSAI